MRYIRTANGKIIDIDLVIKKEKENTNYCDYIFEEPKNENNIGVLRWTAVGAQPDLHDNQYCRRCQFGIEFDKIVKSADTIHELCDYAAIKYKFVELPDIKNLNEMNKKVELRNPTAKYIDNLKFLMQEKMVEYIKFAILTDKGIIYVAEMNKKGNLVLL